MSEDAAAIYLVSREDLDGGGPAAEGEANLYLREAGGGVRFIAALADRDVDPPNAAMPTPSGAQPRLRASRVSGDGGQAAFMSFAPLTGFDNRDLAEGKAVAEVFLYDAEAKGGEGELLCISCNPSGKRPRAGNVGKGGFSFWVAARIPTAENNLHESRAIAANGSRVFFQAFDSLALTDTNGRADVYQWERAGTGTCGEADASFSAAAGGCIDLLSTGQSASDASFAEASPDGEDVFFITLSGLVEGDPGLLDVYDARVGGGLPGPPSPAPECEGEACQSPAPAPEAVTPSSSTYAGPGNLAAPKAKKKKKARRCAKGERRVKRKGRVRCVRVKQQKHARHARRGGRVGR
jgi:hypothetical protein